MCFNMCFNIQLDYPWRENIPTWRFTVNNNYTIYIHIKFFFLIFFLDLSSATKTRQSRRPQLMEGRASVGQNPSWVTSGLGFAEANRVRPMHRKLRSLLRSAIGLSLHCQTLGATSLHVLKYRFLFLCPHDSSYDLILLCAPGAFAFCHFPKMESLLHMSSVTWSCVGVRGVRYKSDEISSLLMCIHVVCCFIAPTATP